MMRSNDTFPALAVFLSALLCHEANAAEKVEFNRDIRPVLSEKCFQCHGPDENAREAGLRLDTPDGDENPFQDRDGSFVIKPGDLEGSDLWYRLTTDDDEAMPPKDAGIAPLTDEQRELVRRWIEQGAPYENYWAFVPPRAPITPTVSSKDWCQNRIDQFVVARHEKEGLAPQPRADKRTLIRRVTFDLTGLPPTREEIRQFVNDPSPDAYQRLVDRLISSPRYGEHMAKYWLDLVRFADTNGIHHDHYREMTPYRDWVIRAFNDNLSFDAFVVDQIAGDLYDDPTIDQQIASGFNRLHLVIDVGTAIPEESFARNVIDRVTAVGTAFMGLTVGCAVCHDHKYDPLTQKDFYQLFAFFNNIDSTPETPGRGIHAPFIRVPSKSQRERLRAIDSRLAVITDEIETLKGSLEIVSADRAGADIEPIDRDALGSRLKEAEEKLRKLQEDKKEVEDTIPVSLVMKERRDVRPAHILVRGAYDQLGEKVERNTPAFLPPPTSTGETMTRMDLARWLTSAEHPLTARVTVNRFWQQFFGVGLVRTSEDFGTQGEWPSHPELLDELTVSFLNSQWDVKTLVRSIVHSETYRQSSKTEMAAYRADPQNRLLARGSRFRLDAEMIRDQILAVSGLLNQTMYGKSVKPPQPPNLWKTVSMVSSSTYSFSPDTGAKIHRRSLYSFWKRALPPPQMTIFDAPTRESCVARRERTNTPLQSLVLMNEGQYFEAARHLARKVLKDGTRQERQRLGDLYESITSHRPDPFEMASLRRGLNQLRDTYRNDPASAKSMTSDQQNASVAERVETAAYTMLINSLFNLDVTKTRQ